MPGKTLKNRYLIEDLDRDQLGKGAFGQTYLAKDTEYRTEQKVVVKHLQPDFSQCRSAAEQQGLLQIAQDFFLREAKILEKLGRVSPQIPSLLDNFTENNEFYIIQEWIDGQPLSKILTHGERLTQKETIQMLIEILEPLDFCHQEGAIHRDLKPDNLMRRHSDGKLVIIDFGAVREMRQLTLISNGPEQPGSRIGTPGYMPLEQTRGFPVLASDVYAVGAIGIQAMTGEYPHNIDLDADGIPKWRERLNCYATAEFAAVLNQMLAVLPSARYVDAATALAALRALPSTSQYIVMTSASPVIANQYEAAVTQPSPAAPTSIIPPSPAITSPQNPIEPQTTQPQKKLLGPLSQDFFSFESAHLEKVKLQRLQPPKKAGWLKGRQAENTPGHNVEEWQIRKKSGQAEYFTEDLGNGVQLAMVYIPSGQFVMGSLTGHDTEQPEHLVHVPGLYLSKFVVTQEQYSRLTIGSTGQWLNAKLPTNKVSWYEAQTFCQKLSVKSGRKYRLPSEAE